MRRSRDPLKLLQAFGEAPWHQDFFQALRDVECAHPRQPRLGTASRPQDEAVRLGQDPSMSFPPATFSALLPAKDGVPPRLLQQFMGLFGPNGALPLHLTEFARERLLNFGDPSLARFADILHHRPVTLFYRAWAQAQPAVSYDRPQSDRFSAYVGSMVGMGTPALRHRDAAGDHVRLFFSGWLSRPVRTAEGLRSILSGFFRLPVRVVEFAGHWLHLPPDDLTRIGTRTSGCALGQGAVLGARVWDRQHAIELRFGPLSYADYEAFLPGGTALHKLVALVRHCLCFEYDWTLRLSLASGEVPVAQLGGKSRLGWTTWIGSGRRRRDAEDLSLDVERVLEIAGKASNRAA